MARGLHPTGVCEVSCDVPIKGLCSAFDNTYVCKSNLLSVANNLDEVHKHLCRHQLGRVMGPFEMGVLYGIHISPFGGDTQAPQTRSVAHNSECIPSFWP